jgi:predicted ATP-dependent endonuclease of OLD family
VRIKTARIKNFRCLQDVTISFDDVTTFIGPNGAGKSTVLRALDWFFNQTPSALDQSVDVFAGAPEGDRTVMVQVTFDRLNPRDRQALGKYAPEGTSTATITLSWDGQSNPKMTGRARAYPPFEHVRQARNATERKERWAKVVEAMPEDSRPAEKIPATQMDGAMAEWESAHPDSLGDVDAATESHMFGFNGKNVMSGIFDYVFISADLRASEEAVDDGKRSVVARLLERTVDKHTVDEQVDQIALRAASDQQEAAEKHLGEQLHTLEGEFTEELAEFTRGRAIRLETHFDPPKRQGVTIKVSVAESDDDTLPLPVERQGHGFQRAMLVAALKLLASKTAQANDGSMIVLAIEEPELYQHPGQARSLAHALRSLADGDNMQVAYATHSPYFVGPHFQEVRRVTRAKLDEGATSTVEISSAPLDQVIADVDGFVDKAGVLNCWHQMWTQSLGEALFADTVILVEGDTDRAILNGASGRVGNRHLSADGIVVAPAYGKNNLFVPHAILARLGIPTLTVFDSDSGQPGRMKQKNKSPKTVSDQDTKNQTENLALLRYHHQTATPYPAGLVADDLFVWDDDLEHEIERSWPEWRAARDRLVDAEEVGDGNKIAATYRLAAQEAHADPGGQIVQVLAAARLLAGVKPPRETAAA